MAAAVFFEIEQQNGAIGDDACAYNLSVIAASSQFFLPTDKPLPSKVRAIAKACGVRLLARDFIIERIARRIEATKKALAVAGVKVCPTVITPEGRFGAVTVGLSSDLFLLQ